MPSNVIDIPCKDIFRHDRLGLEPAIAGRTHALLSHSPQAIAIDGRWGTGKSTFLALWAAYLRSKEIKVVQFNAWKSFGHDPFDALTREILRQVKIPKGQQNEHHKQLLDFLNRYAPIIAQGTKLISALQPELDGVPQALELGLNTLAKVPVSDTAGHSDPIFESPDEFASALSAAAKTWSRLPVVVMVDELDRCNPEYAVEFLQLLEHVFHAENVVFVVAINRTELQHSIKAFYGQGFNAEGYLERFFDDILSLPASNRTQYIASSLDKFQAVDTSNVRLFLALSDLSLREIDKAIQVLESVHVSYANISYSLTRLWVARTLAPGAYMQYLSGGVSDKGLVEAVFANGTCNILRNGQERYHLRVAQQLEATIIHCSGILWGGDMWNFYENPGIASELYRYYQQVVENGTKDAGSVEYARRVLDLVPTDPTSVYSRQDVQIMTLVTRVLERELPPE